MELTEERQRAKDDKKVFTDLTIDFSYLSDEWKKKGLFGRIQSRGPTDPKLSDDLMRAFKLIAYGIPLDHPSHKKKRRKKRRGGSTIAQSHKNTGASCPASNRAN